MVKKIIFFAILLVFLIRIVSAYEIVCLNNDSGIQMWDYKTITEKELIAIRNASEYFNKEQGLNCTFFDNKISPKDCETIISILNSNIKEKNNEITLLTKQKKGQAYFFLFILLFMFILAFLPQIIKYMRRKK